MRHIHLIVFCTQFRACWTARALGSALAGQCLAWGCLLGPASHAGVGWACCCRALPCGAGGLCMLGVCGKSRDLTILTDTKEMNCLTLGFLMETKFWWVLYNKQELLPAANSGSTCPALLPGFSEAVRFRSVWHWVDTGTVLRHCPQALSLLVAASLSFPPR